ncbi:MAG: hypothetical protein ABSC18_03470 [Verrucomicrobiota bacterium]|jgi:hypothetical protein
MTVVLVDKPGAKISPTFYGLMTEEINYSYDGGLCGELIQNRIFKNPPPRGGPGRGGQPDPNTPPPDTNAPAAAGRGRGRGPTGPPPQTMFASSSLDEATGDVILKVINAVETPQQVEIRLEGAPTIGKTARVDV